jgi:hypothetical protein
VFTRTFVHSTRQHTSPHVVIEDPHLMVRRSMPSCGVVGTADGWLDE